MLNFRTLKEAVIFSGVREQVSKADTGKLSAAVYSEQVGE